MTTFKRRVRGTDKQIGKPFPLTRATKASLPTKLIVVPIPDKKLATVRIGRKRLWRVKVYDEEDDIDYEYDILASTPLAAQRKVKKDIVEEKGKTRIYQIRYMSKVGDVERIAKIRARTKDTAKKLFIKKYLKALSKIGYAFSISRIA